MKPMEPLIETHSVMVDYPHRSGLLRLYDEGVSLKVDEGDFVAILAGSGWGKSTLINVILGLEKATRGTIRFRGEDVTQKSFLKRRELVRTAAVFQRPTALPQLTVAQNLSLALSIAGTKKADREERIKESLEFFGLDTLANTYPDSLSAGQRRRIDLARGLAVRPELLVIDEPTGDLDSSASNLLLPLLRGLSSDNQISILITTAQARCAAEANHITRLRPPTFLTAESKLAGI
jgi:ABC-type multidrug transport system ATPase subunit